MNGKEAVDYEISTKTYRQTIDALLGRPEQLQKRGERMDRPLALALASRQRSSMREPYNIHSTGLRGRRRLNRVYRSRRAMLARMIDSLEPERFFVCMRAASDRPVRLPVADMTPDEALAAVVFQERELVHMTKNAAPALELLGRVAAATRRAGGGRDNSSNSRFTSP